MIKSVPKNNTLYFPVCYYLSIKILDATGASVRESLALCRIFYLFIYFFAVSAALLVQLTAQERFSGQLAYSASQLLVMAGVATSHCYPEGAHQHRQTLNSDITYSQTAAG